MAVRCNPCWKGYLAAKLAGGCRGGVGNHHSLVFWAMDRGAVAGIALDDCAGEVDFAGRLPRVAGECF